MTKVTYVRKSELARDTWQFLFKRSKGFLCKAGQYTTLFLGKDNRDFTICTYPSNTDYFSIVTKRGISEFKKKLFLLNPGSKIEMNNPAGGFVLSSNALPKVFLAGGIGITVFYTIIHDILFQKITTPVTLLVSFSKKEDIIFYDELQDIQKKNKNIKIVYTLSQEKWDGEEGRISEKLVKKYVPSFLNAEFMIAGGEQMVYDTEELLLNMKVPQEKIRMDIFTGY